MNLSTPKIAVTALLVTLVFGIGAKPRPELRAWPEDQTEHDLPWNPDTGFKLMPYDEFEREFSTSTTDKMPALPMVPWRAQVRNVSLIASQSPVKNQGGRGQCHNFATTAAMEYAIWAGENKALNFSEQCNAWKFFKDCVFCSKNPASEDSDGGWADREIFFIYDKFMKFEEDFPYSDTDIRTCDREYNDSPYFRFTDIQAYRAKLSQIKAAIDNRFVVVTAVKWRDAGWNAEGEQEYLTQYPNCKKDTCGGHAVVIVGYDDHYYGPNRGGYIFKNSWSVHWGNAKEDKPAGYGVIPYPYLRKFGKNYTAVSHERVSPIGGPDAPGCKKRND